MSLESLKYSRGSLKVIDQLKLPHECVFVDVETTDDAWNVIRSMQVRGAPLIAITAVLGLAVEAYHKMSQFKTVAEASSFLLHGIDYLRTSRPTAVNLFVATDEMTALIMSMTSACQSAVELIETYIDGAEAIYEADVLTNKKMGDYGANRILEIVNKDKIKVLTICNTGSLATAGYGTALGVVRSLHAMGKLEHVYACETRPYNQGARLTAFEIVHDKLPGTLIADSMASALMAIKGVDCIITGADRVAGNGDVANKIGTYQLAISAKYHGIPFFAAVPTTTLDLSMSNGTEIHIEERPAAELTSIFNQKIAPDGIAAWNPAFDVTPCSLVRGIITELGVIEAAADAGSDGVIHIADFIKKHPSSKPVLLTRAEKAVLPVAAPSGYSLMDEPRILQYVLSNGKLRKLLHLLHDDDQSALKISEVGDGNLNYVYIIEGREGSKIIVKQALPYVRCLGESWPMTLQRAYFESTALRIQRELAGELVPEVFHFDKQNALIIMRFIAPPSIILRKSLIHGVRISTFAKDLGVFMGKTLFHTSAAALDGGTLRSNIAHWSQNNAMCALTEKVIFTDPYMDSAMNRWTRPHLDAYVEGIRADNELKLAAAYHKGLFLTKTEALLHGDLHTGSVMASEGQTFVIDPEFAFYGPIGFDVGAVLANLFLSYFSHFCSPDTSYPEWILEQVNVVYSTFESVFLSEWKSSGGRGELFPDSVFPAGSAILLVAQQEYLRSIWLDTLGFAGMKMIRRIVGVAHVEDLKSIQDALQRSICEKKALKFAASLVLHSYRSKLGKSTNSTLGTIDELVIHAKVHFAAEFDNQW